MPESRLTVATRKARLAQAALDAAVLAGQDATEARARLQQAEEEVEAAKAAEAERIQATEAKIHTEAESIVSEVSTQVQSEQGRILSLIEQPGTPAAAIEHAVSLVRARGEAAEADAAVEAARVNLTAIEQRVGHLTAQRAAIVARRASGIHEDSDGADLALLQADAEVMGNARTDARQALAAAELRAAAAAEAKALAERRWEGETRRAWQGGMRSVANQVERATAVIADNMRDRGTQRYEPKDQTLIDHLYGSGYSPHRSRAA